MKKLVYLSILLVLVLGSVSVAAQAPEKPAPDRGAMLGTAPRAGIEDISGSYAAWDNGAYGDVCSSGGTDYLCFDYFVQSGSYAWPYGLQMKLPAGWNASNGYLLSYSCSLSAYPGDLSFTGGNEPIFSQTWYLGSSYEYCNAVYCMDVTTGGPASINWYIDSDGYGGGVVDTCDTGGYYACGEAVMPPADVPSCEPGIYLNPDAQSGEACEGEDVAYTLSLYNNSGADGTFDLDYTSVFPISGPASIFVANATAQDFDVTVTLPCGGQSDTATIVASGNGYSDPATITTNLSAGGWGTVPASAPTWAGMGYPRDGCSALNAAGEWVTYLFGDTSGIFGFWGYNHDTNSWFQPGAANTPADRWAPDWAYDEATNLCYVTGGGNTPGGGTYTDAYVFDPVANAFASLGNFTSARDFHNSWVGTIDGTKYLCIGGGVNSASVLIQATQCYDIAGGFWNAENAQMAAFPTDPFGAADGILHAAGGDQFWYIGGAINNFGTVTDEARYWDDADNTWHLAGNTGVGRYRVEGDFLDGAFYQLGGSSGGFTYTADIVVGTWDGANWNWSTTGQLANARMDNIATIADGTIWSVDGYGASSANYVEKLIECEPCSGDLTLTCGLIAGWGTMDPYGRFIVRWRVWAVDQDTAPAGEVAVTADLVSAARSGTRTRMSHNFNGVALFPWGSNTSGYWSIDVSAMVKAGYTFIDGPQCFADGLFE